jgi:hypothetical protein
MIVGLPCGGKVNTDNLPAGASEFQCSKGCVHPATDARDAAIEKAPLGKAFLPWPRRLEYLSVACFVAVYAGLEFGWMDFAGSVTLFGVELPSGLVLLAGAVCVGVSAGLAEAAEDLARLLRTRGKRKAGDAG